MRSAVGRVLLAILIAYHPVVAQAPATQVGAADQVAASFISQGYAELARSQAVRRPRFDRAVKLFHRALKVDSRRADAWRGVALAERARGRWEIGQPLELGSRVGAGAFTRAVRAAVQALAVSPDDVVAARLASDLAIELRDTALIDEVTRRLQEVPRGVTSPAVRLALVKLERAAGRPGSAMRLADGGPASGETRGELLLEFARSALALNESGGAQAYYRAALSSDSLTVAGLRADLALIATADELARFDASRGRARQRLLHEFWTDRDRREMRRPGERLAEHYRRLQYANRHFALTVTRRFHGRRDAYRGADTGLDDRGVVYVRHGAPERRLRPFVFGLMPNETWRYRQADGDLLLHFSAGYDGEGGGDLYDYRLVESVLDLRGAADAPRDQLLLSRDALAPEYARMMTWGRYGAARAESRERGIGAASIAFATANDTDELRFALPLTVRARMLAFGRRGAGRLAHLVFAVAGTDSLPRSADDVYRVRVRAVVLDSRDHAVGNLDTTITSRLARPLGRGQQLIGRAELVLPRGAWSWRAAVALDDSTGAVVLRDSIAIDGETPAMSDLAFGLPGASARWVRAAGDTLLLSPFDRVIQGGTVELAYEVDGTTRGRSYQHEIRVLRRDRQRGIDRGKPLIALASAEVAHDSVVVSRRTIGLSALKSGDYTFEVRVRMEDGRTLVRRRGFTVLRVPRRASRSAR